MCICVLEREIYWIVLWGMGNPTVTGEAEKLRAADFEGQMHSGESLISVPCQQWIVEW